MKENQLKNKTVGGEHTEIALEIHMKETEGVLIMQLSLFVIQHFVMLSLSVLLVFRSSSSVKSLSWDSSLTGVGCFVTYIITIPTSS